MKRYDRFFTMWALGLHIVARLAAEGSCAFLPQVNTFILAVFVAVGSVLLREFVAKEPMSVDRHVLLHFAPVVLVKPPSSSLWNWANWAPLILLIVLYLTYHEFDVCRLYHFYEYSDQALNNKI